MGNTVSSYDYAAQLNEGCPVKYATVIGEADKTLPFGQIYRNTGHAELPQGWNPRGTDDHFFNLLKTVEIGAQHGGLDNDWLGQREWRVHEGEAPPIPAKAPKGYQFSGYAERKDGTIDRFAYKYMSYAQAIELYQAFGRGLISLGVQPGQHCGIFAVNRPEWLITQWAYWSQRLSVVPLYATLAPDAIEYIINHAETPVVVVTKENFGKLVKALPSIQGKFLQHIVVIDGIADNFWGNFLDGVTEEQRKALEGSGIQLHNMSDVITMGREEENVAQIPLQDAQGDDLAYICYTSGTTGTPKGVMLTHCCLTSCLDGCQVQIALQKGETYFSYLPLAHIFEVICNALCVSGGMKIAFSQGDVRQITSDLQGCLPHIVPGVPRIWTKFYQAIFAGIDALPFYKRWYVIRAYNYQLYQLYHGLPLDPTYDQTIFASMREKMGLTNIRVMITGAAATPAYLVAFMRVLTNAWLTQGYGMTETCAGTSISRPEDHTIGACGAPFGSDFRVASLPDMGYLHTDAEPRGELLLSGEPIFKGYYKNQEATQTTLIPDETGRLWLRTGDVAKINPTTGHICIIDRAKSLLKLSQGEYVSLEKVQNLYGQSSLVGQLFVYGNGYKSALVAICAPNIMPFYQYAVEQGWWGLEEVPVQGALSDAVIEHCQHLAAQYQAEINAWMFTSLQQCEAHAAASGGGGLLGFEKIKAVHCDVQYDALGQVFTEAKNLLTPTMKLKAQPLAKHYIAQLKQLYQDIQEPDNGEIPYW